MVELEAEEVYTICPDKNQFAATVLEISDFYKRYHPFLERPESSEPEACLETVRECFEGRGCTGKLGGAKIETATRLRQPAISLTLVLDAMLLGACRKVDLWSNGWPSDPIQSLRYFEPLIAEIQAMPLPSGYPEHLQNQRQRLLIKWRSENN